MSFKPANPYQALPDDNTDEAEHLSEVAAGMALNWSRPPRNYNAPKWASLQEALDNHRRQRRELQAQLAAERERAA